MPFLPWGAFNIPENWTLFLPIFAWKRVWQHLSSVQNQVTQNLGGRQKYHKYWSDTGLVVCLRRSRGEQLVFRTLSDILHFL
jgi:hypothetical protein